MQTSVASLLGKRRSARTLAIGAGILALGLAALGVGVASHARPVVIAELSRRVGRPVHVDGDLSFHPMLGAFTVRFTRLHVDQAAWAGPAPMLSVDTGLVTLPWTALLGSVRVRDLQVNGLHLMLRRDAEGRANWSDGKDGPAPHLPRIARIAVRNSTLDYQDLTRALTFQGGFSVTPNGAGPPVLNVSGHGRCEDGIWATDVRSTTDLTGAAPYLLSGRLVIDKPSGHSAVRFSGRLTPTAGGRLQVVLDGAGPDLHDLSHLINAPLPHTPPYALHAQLDRTRKVIRLQAIAGRVGASDVAGALTITPAAGGRRLDGALHARSLRISDLFSVASGGHLTAAHSKAGRVLPDATINPVPLRKLTGAIRFTAASVQAPTTPTIRSLQLLATFDRGRVAAAPMTLVLAHGQAVIGFVLDVRDPVPKVALDADFRRADTSDFRKSRGARPPLQADFDGAIHLRGAGPSLAEAATHASGTIRLAAVNGRLQETQAAVLSANLVHGVLSLLGRNHADTPLKCAVARFQVSDGQARATALHIVTGLGGINGYGGFNLGSETVDLTLRPAPPALLGVTSVRIEGPMSRPRATLALDNPTGIVRHALTGLLHPAPAKPPATASCA